MKKITTFHIALSLSVCLLSATPALVAAPVRAQEMTPGQVTQTPMQAVIDKIVAGDDAFLKQVVDSPGVVTGGMTLTDKETAYVKGLASSISAYHTNFRNSLPLMSGSQAGYFARYGGSGPLPLVGPLEDYHSRIIDPMSAGDKSSWSSGVSWTYILAADMGLIGIYNNELHLKLLEGKTGKDELRRYIALMRKVAQRAETVADKAPAIVQPIYAAIDKIALDIDTGGAAPGGEAPPAKDPGAGGGTPTPPADDNTPDTAPDPNTTEGKRRIYEGVASLHTQRVFASDVPKFAGEVEKTFGADSEVAQAIKNRDYSLAATLMQLTRDTELSKIKTPPGADFYLTVARLFLAAADFAEARAALAKANAASPDAALSAQIKTVEARMALAEKCQRMLANPDVRHPDLADVESRIAQLKSDLSINEKDAESDQELARKLSAQYNYYNSTANSGGAGAAGLFSILKQRDADRKQETVDSQTAELRNLLQQKIHLVSLPRESVVADMLEKDGDIECATIALAGLLVQRSGDRALFNRQARLLYTLASKDPTPDRLDAAIDAYRHSVFFTPDIAPYIWLSYQRKHYGFAGTLIAVNASARAHYRQSLAEKEKDRPQNPTDPAAIAQAYRLGFDGLVRAGRTQEAAFIGVEGGELLRDPALRWGGAALLIPEVGSDAAKPLEEALDDLPKQQERYADERRKNPGAALTDPGPAADDAARLAPLLDGARRGKSEAIAALRQAVTAGGPHAGQLGALLVRLLYRDPATVPEANQLATRLLTGECQSDALSLTVMARTVLRSEKVAPDTALALALTNQAVKLNADQRAEPLCLRAEVLYAQGKHDEALADLTKAWAAARRDTLLPEKERRQAAEESYNRIERLAKDSHDKAAEDALNAWREAQKQIEEARRR